MTRAEILEQARVCVCREREQDYGSLDRNFETIAYFWDIYLRAAHFEYNTCMTEDALSAKDVAAMMALLKIARIATGNSVDSFVDLAGYAACGGEIATEPPDLTAVDEAFDPVVRECVRQMKKEAQQNGGNSGKQGVQGAGTGADEAAEGQISQSVLRR